ncbi:hypothetical protein GH714_005839 [Hevea brasiliensis]|uniref:Uncharacterized protein n=1 Tax=Hevea brasiliensis TaxID=3981 RepID=A0A6A6KBW3_HEVBR|nr:hypothetical protein GH714_005839 [Hevea brasiliensis]
MCSPRETIHDPLNSWKFLVFLWLKPVISYLALSFQFLSFSTLLSLTNLSGCLVLNAIEFCYLVIGKLTKSNDASDVKSANASDVSSHDGSSKIAMEITEAIDDVNLLTTVKVIKGYPKDYQSFKAIVQATLKWLKLDLLLLENQLPFFILNKLLVTSNINVIPNPAESTFIKMILSAYETYLPGPGYKPDQNHLYTRGDDANQESAGITA